MALWAREKENIELLTIDNFEYKGEVDGGLSGKINSVSGGRITKEEIDELKDYPYLRSIEISGLRQEEFEYFIEKYGRQFTAIRFFKNKMVNDLSALGTLENLEYVYWFYNQKAEKLWDMTYNKNLKGLSVKDFSRLKTLENVETAPNLKYLSFGDEIWSKSKIETVPDLSKSTIEKIIFDSEMSLDNVMKLFKIESLKEIDFRSNMFATEVYAWIAANYPHIKGRIFAPYYEGKSNYTETINGITRKVNSKYAQVVGKRKPYIEIVDDKSEAKLEKYRSKFDDMINKYKGMKFDEFKKEVKL